MSSELDRDEQLLGFLDEALAAGEDGRPVDTLAGQPELAAEGRQLLRVIRDFVAAATEWQSVPETDGENQATGTFAPQVAPIPERVGRYAVRERIGSGGMGDVYRAHDPQLDREVALKLPRFDPARSGATRQAERFLREARAAAAVRHPNVCPIHDVGEHEGRPFVVMALVRGESLADRIRRTGRARDPREAVRLTAQVAGGLAAVHAHGIVHRDLKPANILIDSDGNPLLSDFGLARSLLDDQRLTHDGAVMGTPAYMPPEQACGDADVGPAADVYSLGVVLYELLTGQLPFPRGSVPTALYHVVNTPPTPPTDHRPDLEPALVAILDKALAKNAADRFPDGRAFCDALELSLRGPTVGVQTRPRSWAERRSAWTAVGGLVLGAILVAAWTGGPLNPAPHGSAAPTGGDERPQIPAPTGAGAARSLDADLMVGISTPAGAAPPGIVKRDLRVDQDGSLPVRSGEVTQIRVRLNQPAYCYLLWIDSRGEVQPAYPWDIAHSKDGWKAPWVTGGTVAQTSFSVPDGHGEGLEIGGPAGLETVVLLARRAPLPAEVDLAALTGRLPASPLHDRREVAWLDLRAGDRRVVESKARYRSVVAGQTRPVDRPLFALLEDRLREHFELIKGVRFAHAGLEP